METDDAQPTDPLAQRIQALSKLSTTALTAAIALYLIYSFAQLIGRKNDEYVAWLVSNQRIMEQCVGLKETQLPTPSEILSGERGG